MPNPRHPLLVRLRQCRARKYLQCISLLLTLCYELREMYTQTVRSPRAWISSQGSKLYFMLDNFETEMTVMVLNCNEELQAGSQARQDRAI